MATAVCVNGMCSSKCAKLAGASAAWPTCMYDISTVAIGIPCNCGQGKPGVARGPQRLREYGVLKSIVDMGFNVRDKGDIELSDIDDDATFANVKRPRAVGMTNKLVASKVACALKHGHSVLTLGGDHSLGIGSVIGQSRVQSDFGLIWVDAHADLNPPLASGSGNAHGMPVAFLIKELRSLIPKDIPGMEWIEPCLHANQIAYIGLRDLDQAEKVILEKYNIAAYSMFDIAELGIAKVVQLAIDAVSNNNTRPLHLSFDIDSLDPSVAPCTGVPAPGGLSLRDGIYITEKIAATGRLTVMDLVEVNPELGTAQEQELTLQAASEIVGAWFGRRSRLQIQPGYTIPAPASSGVPEPCAQG